jgi:hypothetical protein
MRKFKAVEITDPAEQAALEERIRLGRVVSAYNCEPDPVSGLRPVAVGVTLTDHGNGVANYRVESRLGSYVGALRLDLSAGTWRFDPPINSDYAQLIAAFVAARAGENGGTLPRELRFEVGHG